MHTNPMSPSPSPEFGGTRPAGQGGTQLPLSFDASKFRPDFYAWLAENEAIWHRFVAEANKLWDRGRGHWSARTIIEYLRHETALSEQGGLFKINNNFAPDMARLYADTYPDRASLFETRRQAGSARVA
jgi:hypothetical protein